MKEESDKQINGELEDKPLAKTSGRRAVPLIAVATIAIIVVIAIAGWLGEVVTRKEAMGLGDVTLMAFVGAALGPTRALITVFVGATLGAIAFTLVVIPVAMARRSHVREQTELALGAPSFETPLVPFGVFLAPAALLTLFWGDALLAWLTRA